MRVLRGVVYMTMSSGPRTEPRLGLLKPHLFNNLPLHARHFSGFYMGECLAKVQARLWFSRALSSFFGSVVARRTSSM